MSYVVSNYEKVMNEEALNSLSVYYDLRGYFLMSPQKRSARQKVESEFASLSCS